MFRGHIRRSGTLRSVWHRRERKRRPLDPRAADLIEQPRPTVRYRYRPTEAEWQSGDPGTMLRSLVHLATDRGTVFHLSRHAVERKLRLFYCACCRLRWEVLPVTARQAVEVIERYADGRATGQELRTARRAAEAASLANRPVWAGGYAPGAWDVMYTVALAVAAGEVHARLRPGYVRCGSPVSSADQVALLHDIFGNPFGPVGIAGAWLTSTVRALARVIHADRAFHLMPVLGDALQDAGCTRAEVLERCYGSGLHAAGCWLVDRLLGKE